MEMNIRKEYYFDYDKKTLFKVSLWVRIYFSNGWDCDPFSRHGADFT